MDRIGRLERRLDQLEQRKLERKYYFVSARPGEEKPIPDEYDPENDILFITTYESRTDKRIPKFTWRGRPYDRRVK